MSAFAGDRAKLGWAFGLLLLGALGAASVGIRTVGDKGLRTGFAAVEAPRDSSTCMREWGAAQTIVGPGSVSPLTMVALRRNGDGTAMILGGEVAHWDRPLPPGSAALFTIDGTRLEKPGGGAWLAYPRGDFDASGRFHLVWAEPDEASRGVPNWAMLQTERLMHSVLTPEHGWTEPDTVLSGARVGWAPARGTVRADPPRGVALVVPLPPDSILYMDLVLGPESAERLAADVALYTDWVTTEGATRYLAYIAHGDGPEPLPPSAGNSVFVRRFSGDGWEPPVQVQLSLDGRATDVRVLAVTPDTLVMLWGQATGSAVFSSRLRLVRSEDGGRTWSRPSDLRTAHQDRYAATVDTAGNVHVVWFAAPAFTLTDQRRLMYACWDGEWSEPHAPFDDRVGRGLAPAMDLRPDGSLELVWTHVGDGGALGRSTSLLKAVAGARVTVSVHTRQ